LAVQLHGFLWATVDMMDQLDIVALEKIKRGEGSNA
jgi:hypothetical protein